MKQNVSQGNWAVAIVGYRGWMRDSAIGDGITTARSALITRVPTNEEADTIVARLTAALPSVLPGSPDVPVYAAVPYRRTDYIGRQQLECDGARDHYRRIVHLDDV